MGHVHQIRKDLSAYSSPSALVLPDEIDTTEMSAGFVICSATEDREGDVMDPQGCREYLDEYRANPIVLYDHNHDSAHPPIGLSEDEQKRFSLRIYNDRITARCYFHGQPFGKENLSLDIFNLVVKGALRGASVGFLPIPGMMASRPGGGKFYRGFRLTEWSITPLQSNQDCLRMCLSRGEVQTKSLAASLKSNLTPTPEWANGFNPESDMELVTASVRFEKSKFKSMDDAVAWLRAHNIGGADPVVADAGAAWLFGKNPKKTLGKKHLDKGVTAHLTKALPKDDEEEDDKTDDKPEGKPDGKTDEVPDDEGGDDEPGNETEAGDEAPAEAEDHSEKQGAKDLAVLMEHFESLIEALPDILKRTDNDSVRKGIAKIQAEAAKLVEHIGAVAGKAYPGLDLASLKPGNAMASEDVGEEVESETGQDVGNEPTPEPDGADGGDMTDKEDDDDIFKSLASKFDTLENKSKSLRITG